MADIKFGTDLDFEKKYVLKNVLLQQVAGDIATPAEGLFWIDTVTGRPKIRNGAATTQLALLTDTTGFVPNSLYDPNSILFATTDNTPAALTVGASTVVGRDSTGGIVALTKAQLLTILNVADGAQVNDTAAQILAKLITVDGAASGLDADLLGGVASANYALKSYVDSAIQGIDIKDAARAATTANITLSGTQTIDGVVLVANDRVLVKNQTTASQNGVYVVAAGAWTRTTDTDTAAEIESALVFVKEGTTNANTQWYMGTDAVTLGTTNLAFTQFGGGTSYTNGQGISIAGNVISIPNGGVTDAMLASTFIKKFTQTIGDGTTTSFALTHNFNTRALGWSVLDTTTNDYVLIMPNANTVNQSTFVFKNAPAASQYAITLWA